MATPTQPRLLRVNWERLNALERTPSQSCLGGRAPPKPILRRVSEADNGATADELIRARILNVALIPSPPLPAPLQSRPEALRPVSLTLDAGAICRTQWVRLSALPS
jgi:hypothetical protein